MTLQDEETFDRVWIDEVAEISEETWNNLEVK